jgi:hypothetical protein
MARTAPLSPSPTAATAAAAAMRHASLQSASREDSPGSGPWASSAPFSKGLVIDNVEGGLDDLEGGGEEIAEGVDTSALYTSLPGALAGGSMSTSQQPHQQQQQQQHHQQPLVQCVEAVGAGGKGVPVPYPQGGSPGPSIIVRPLVRVAGASQLPSWYSHRGDGAF